MTGTGGIGKTRLAIHLAAELAPDYPDGAWFVELAALTDPALIAQQAAVTIGALDVTSGPTGSALAETIGQRRLLLVLDNCEHLLAAAASLAETLLLGCPELRILATSRQPLGLHGEVAWRVPSLSLPLQGSGVRDQVSGSSSTSNSTSNSNPNPIRSDPSDWSDLSDPSDANHQLSTPQECESVRLFVERARAANPCFTPGENNALAIATICRRLDGIPLALEMAAARLRALSVEQVAEQLDDRFGLLTTGSSTALPRHQTLRATLDWSWELLSDPERALLRRLSVFSGPFTLEDAAAVCGHGDDEWTSGRVEEWTPPAAAIPPDQPPLVHDPLARVPPTRPFVHSSIRPLVHSSAHPPDIPALVEKSLVLADTGEPEARYRLLETTRQHAWEQLVAAGEADVVRDRHAARFLALAEESRAHLHGPEQGRWLRRLVAAHDNARAALEWCLGQLETSDDSHSTAALAWRQVTGLRLAAALLPSWHHRGYLAEGRLWLDRALRAVPEATPTRAAALAGAGQLAMSQGDTGAAERLLEESLALAREVGDEPGVVRALSALGATAYHRSDYDSALRLTRDSLAIAERLGHVQEIASALNHLGNIAYALGDHAEAARCHERCLAMQETACVPSGAAWSLANLGDTALARGEPDMARDYYRRGLRLFADLDHRPGTAECLRGLAMVAAGAAGREDQLRAARLFGAAAALRDSIGFYLAPAWGSDTERGMATVRAALGPADFAAARVEGEAMTPESAIALALDP